MKYNPGYAPAVFLSILFILRSRPSLSICVLRWTNQENRHRPTGSCFTERDN